MNRKQMTVAMVVLAVLAFGAIWGWFAMHDGPKRSASDGATGESEATARIAASHMSSASDGVAAQSQAAATTPVVTGGEANVQAAAGSAWRAHAVELEALVGQLADDGTRAAALELLNKIPYQQLQELRMLARSEARARVKEDLERRANEIQEALTAEQPPISVHLREAPLEALVYAFNAEMGTRIRPSLLPPRDPQAYTVNEEAKPFWEVMATAAQQHPFTFNAIDNWMYLSEGGGGMARCAIQGPLCVYGSVRDNRLPPGMAAARTLPALQWNLVWGFGVDPRLRALEAPVSLSMSPDDVGNVLVSPPAPVSRRGPIHFIPGNAFYGVTRLTISEHPGTRIPSVKVEGKLILAVTEVEAVAENIPDAGTTISLGGTEVSVSFRDISATHMQADIKATRTDGKTAYATFELADGRGERVYNATIRGGGGIGTSGHTGPFRMVVKVPTKIEERAVSMEIKDVPLPGVP